MKKVLAISYTAVAVAVIFWNYYVSVVGFNGETMGSVSRMYQNLFTPAGYAFSIWGPIFFGILAHGYYQIRKAFFDTSHNDFILQIGPWFTLANIANGVWVWFWLTGHLLSSVLTMIFILFSLIMVFIKLNMERWDAPFKVIRWVWWPVAFYAGWISVAIIANVAAYLKGISFESTLSETTWTVIMLIVAMLVNLFMLIFRSSREFVAVGIWALIAIAVNQWDGDQTVKWTALGCMLALFAAINVHAYIHWDTNPLNKMLQKRRTSVN